MMGKVDRARSNAIKCIQTVFNEPGAGCTGDAVYLLVWLVLVLDTLLGEQNCACSPGSSNTDQVSALAAWRSSGRSGISVR